MQPSTTLRRFHILASHLSGSGGPPPAAFVYGGSDAGEEFASEKWCLLCAAEGAALLQEAADAGSLDLSTCTWGFSEEYYNTPHRLMGARTKAVYWFYVTDGTISSGAGTEIPAACLVSLPTSG